MKEKIDKSRLPQHIAIIMDGNGRWAKKKGAVRLYGHQRAVRSVKEVTEGCAELGVKFLTLYAFSTENWNRPKLEVQGLMELLVRTLRRELNELKKNNVRMSTIGDIASLPKACEKELRESVAATADNTGLTLILALNYSGRFEITEAVRNIGKDLIAHVIREDEIDSDLISRYLFTSAFPDPELLIRTSGEMRVSNFLLWQIAYTELYITDVLWPDFRKQHLYEAIVSYQQRERRFGKISEQVQS